MQSNSKGSTGVRGMSNDEIVALVAERLALQATQYAELEAENLKLRNECAKGVHTCHANCPRPMCVLRRERDALEAENQQLRRFVGVCGSVITGIEDRE